MKRSVTVSGRVSIVRDDLIYVLSKNLVFDVVGVLHGVCLVKSIDNGGV